MLTSETMIYYIIVSVSLKKLTREVGEEALHCSRWIYFSGGRFRISDSDRVLRISKKLACGELKLTTKSKTVKRP